MTGTDVSRWADAAMFRSEPMPGGLSKGSRAYLINATPDPLGSLAALCEMYQGRVVRSLNEVTDVERQYWFAEVLKSPLQGPLESVSFHFLVEGVTRAFTHQMVRGRHAFYAQESLRFAVVDNEPWLDRIGYPPTLAAEPEQANPLDPTDEHGRGYLSDAGREYALRRDTWDDAVITAQNAYNRLIEAGIPAEDARGLMPHAILTRLHWVCSLRELIYVAGLRLCTQAQFEWRQVMAQVVNALRQYDTARNHDWDVNKDGWQFAAIADKLKPVCYNEGRCSFMAKDDRACAIRGRVNANARAGRPSAVWHEPAVDADSGAVVVEAISPYEWAADPTAARKRGQE